MSLRSYYFVSNLMGIYICIYMSMFRASPSQKPKGSMMRWWRALHRNPQGEYDALGRDLNIMPLRLWRSVPTDSFTETEREYDALEYGILHRNPQGKYDALDLVYQSWSRTHDNCITTHNIFSIYTSLLLLYLFFYDFLIYIFMLFIQSFTLVIK